MAAKHQGNLVDLLPYATAREAAAVNAVLEHGTGPKAAAVLGVTLKTVQERLKTAKRRMRAGVAPAVEAPVAPRVDGAVRIGETHPAPAGLRRYILTCQQNNTHVHPGFWANLQAAAEFYRAELKVARFSYNTTAYRDAKSVKAGRLPARDEGLWFDPVTAPYVCDDPTRHGSCRYRLAPDLLWCAEMNILPTAVRPLSGLDAYAGSSSGIFPHAKIALESLPRPAGAAPKFNITTGACTLRNYIQKKEGIKAEFHHAYGALLVEVSPCGQHWWARHLNATNDGAFYDLTRRFADGRVSLGHRIEAMNWGDIHASEIDDDVREINWAPGGVLDVLRPRYQIAHDLLSFRVRGHHEQKSYEARLLKFSGHVPAGDSVELECAVTANLLRYAARPWCQTVVVCSNHDRHGERWLEETDYRSDLPNAEFFLEAQLARTRALKTTGRWAFLPWAMARFGVEGARFLARDERFTLCADSHPVECGWHGDEGPNGSRGSPQSLVRLSIRTNIGHGHALTLRDGLAAAGACARRFDYEHGPSSHSVSHLGTYANGKRVGLVQRNGKLWL